MRLFLAALLLVGCAAAPIERDAVRVSLDPRAHRSVAERDYEAACVAYVEAVFADDALDPAEWSNQPEWDLVRFTRDRLGR